MMEYLTEQVGVENLDMKELFCWTSIKLRKNKLLTKLVKIIKIAIYIKMHVINFYKRNKS